MNSDDLKTRARAPRATGSTPKQIARTLGILRARAVSLIHADSSPRPDHTTGRPEDSTPRDRQLIGCWITRQWSDGLTIDQRRPDWIDDSDLPPMAIGAGPASIAVARGHTGTEVSVCGYLVDTYCQGVKNAVPPNTLDRRDLPAFLADFFAAYHTDPLPAPITLVQDLVLGAVDPRPKPGLRPAPRLPPGQTTPRRLAATQPHPIRTARQAILPTGPLRQPYPDHAHPQQIGRTRQLRVHDPHHHRQRTRITIDNRIYHDPGLEY